MKLTTILVLIISQFLLPVTPPSYGVFGMSTCEKVMKQIENEEQIILQTEIHLNNARINFNNNWTEGIALTYATFFSSMMDSQINQFNLVVKNPKCFKVTAQSDARYALKAYQNERIKIKTLMSNDNYKRTRGQVIGKADSWGNLLEIRKGRK